MTYDLVIGDRGYSSWSLRGGFCSTLRLARKAAHRPLYTDELAAILKDFFPARTAPTMRTPEAASSPRPSPSPRNWPPPPRRRDLARRPTPGRRHVSSPPRACRLYGAAQLLPMNLRVSYTDCQPTDDVLKDCSASKPFGLGTRDDEIHHPRLCGPYSAADAFFARSRPGSPPTTSVSAAAMVYVNAHLAHPSFRRWRAMGLVDGADQEFYRRDYPRRDWPGPVRLPARAVTGTDTENQACSYSGKPVTHALELYGRRFGFCNAFCRDKTVADPEAWPKFMALYHS